MRFLRGVSREDVVNNYYVWFFWTGARPASLTRTEPKILFDLFVFTRNLIDRRQQKFGHFDLIGRLPLKRAVAVADGAFLHRRQHLLDVLQLPYAQHKVSVEKHQVASSPLAFFSASVKA